MLNAAPTRPGPAQATAGATVADRVRAQLGGDYPAKALAWIGTLTWTGPVQVPLTQIDWAAGPADWQAAAADKAKIKAFRARIRGGWRKPVILVRRPGSRLLLVVDGHGRCTASKGLNTPVTAYVGTATTPAGPWDDVHSRQFANTAEHVVELVGPKGYEHGWKFVGVPGDSLGAHTKGGKLTPARRPSSPRDRSPR